MVFNRQCWEVLVWMDSANYGGVKGRLPEDIENVSNDNVDSIRENEDEDGEDQAEDEVNTIYNNFLNIFCYIKIFQATVIMSWNIAQLLPEEANCRNNFNAVVAGYINAIYHRLKQGEQVNVSALPASQPTFGLTHDIDIEYSKELLTTEISQTLFQ